MCDYSLHSVRTRPAKVAEKLVTHNFGTGTRGFAAPEDCSVAVCLLPGTELAFKSPGRSLSGGLLPRPPSSLRDAQVYFGLKEEKVWSRSGNRNQR